MGLAMNSNKVYMTWYPNKVHTSYHSVRLHVIPLMNTLCTTMCWNIRQLFKWSNYVSLFAYYPNSIDKSRPNFRCLWGHCFFFTVQPHLMQHMSTLTLYKPMYLKYQFAFTIVELNIFLGTLSQLKYLLAFTVVRENFWIDMLS